MEVSLIGFAVLLILVFLRVPIAFAMGLVGVVGFTYLVNSKAALSMVAQVAFDTGLAYGLSVVPLFVLMGNFVTEAGLSSQLYRASNAFLGHRRGGLAMATIVACGGFSAVCGSSLATAATMARVAMPSMRKYGYADSLAAGSIAAGGTLGILIPPSVIMVIYGILTETNIGKLFIAGVIPGLIGVLFYMGAVVATTRINPDAGPNGPRTSWPDRMQALAGVWGILILFILVIGGIYAGWFTPTEAA
ncbi:MAG: TRAP transporter large permease subunit, partial [Hyphomicrobiales bacterium]|nr:TRAP transporter large permease subunit [Hyphomicrobiales bacterium]